MHARAAVREDTYTRVCVYTRMCIYIRVYVYVRVFVYVRVYVRMLYMHACAPPFAVIARASSAWDASTAWAALSPSEGRVLRAQSASKHALPNCRIAASMHTHTHTHMHKH